MGVGLAERVSAERIRAQALPGQATPIQGGGGVVGQAGSGFWKPVDRLSASLADQQLSSKLGRHRHKFWQYSGNSQPRKKPTIVLIAGFPCAIRLNW